MLSILALVFTSHSLGDTKPQVAEVPSRIPIQGYLPTHLPILLSKLTPKSVEAVLTSIRGFRTIIIDWEVKMPQAKAAAEIAAGYSLKGFGHSDTGGTWNTVHLGDRTVAIYTQPGRSVPAPSPFPNRPASKYVDTGTYTEVTICEWPLPLGPMPSNWPEKAKKLILVPAEAPIIPIEELKRVPQVVSYSNLMDDGVGEYYNFTWFIEESKDMAYPRWIEILEKSDKWSITRSGKGAYFFKMVDKKSVEISFPDYDHDLFQLPKEWCSVNMSWQVKAR
jgi:hypothetical protein